MTEGHAEGVTFPGLKGHWSDSYAMEIFLFPSTPFNPSMEKSKLAQIVRIDSKFCLLQT